MALIQIQVPDIGDFDSVGVIELLVKPGDSVNVEQSLITVESDKASMEIPSSHAGVVRALTVQIGDKVQQGSVIAELEVAEIPTSEPKPAQPTANPGDAASKDIASMLASVVASTAAAAAAMPVNAAAPAQAVASSIEVRLPDIGDFKDVAVIELLAQPGESIRVEQSLFTVESDKASMEIPSPVAGVLKQLLVKVGDRINIGDLVALLEGAAGMAASVATATAPTAPTAAPAAAAVAGTPQPAVPQPVANPPVSLPASEPAHQPGQPVAGLPHASPSVRKFARELGVPLAELKGTGPKGRITAEDVQAFTRAVMAGSVQTQAQAAKAPAPSSAGGSTGLGLELLAWPKVDFAKFGPIERKDLSRIKKLSGANLARNWVMIPHVTNNDEADITELEAFRVQTNREGERAKSSVKVTMLAFVIKAVVAALKKYPEFNASLDGDALVYKQYFHIGFAADTPNGLVVPVLKNADQKGILQISAEMAELAKKARDGKLGAADMQGGCFTISSLGGIGGTHFTPIINAPEVAILGLSRSSMQPIWNEEREKFLPRLMLPLSLSYDHRVIDGAAAARFNAHLGQLLADYRRIVL